MATKKQPAKDLAYYLTLFKTEGHTTWRCHFGSDKKGFDREKAQWSGAPKVTAKKILRVDRLDGSISPVHGQE